MDQNFALIENVSDPIVLVTLWPQYPGSEVESPGRGNAFETPAVRNSFKSYVPALADPSFVMSKKFSPPLQDFGRDELREFIDWQKSFPGRASIS
jgi:hypothetical protein